MNGCAARFGEAEASILDISFIRLVTAKPEGHGLPMLAECRVDFNLDRIQFSAQMVLNGEGEDWLRFNFVKLLPSGGAHLRSFLSPKRVGESIREDWRNEEIRHYHGLNESELWFDQNGRILFSYLDSFSPAEQFVVAVPEGKGPLVVGKVPREQYIEMASFDSNLALTTLSDREMYSRLGECRDVVTNFRPSGQMEYHLKQRLLKVISEHLYSTSRKVEMFQPKASTPRTTSTPISAS